MQDETHKDDDLYEDEKILRHRKYHGHEDVIPSWRNYAMAFLLGFGIAASAASCFYQRLKEEHKKPEKQYVEVDDCIYRKDCSLIGTEKSRRLWKLANDELLAKFGRYPGQRVEDAMADSICEVYDDNKYLADEEKLEHLVETMRDERTPVSKLMQKYKGPTPVPAPTPEEQEKARKIYEQNKEYRSLLLAFMDEDFDGERTEEEKSKAAYKLLHQ